MSVQPSHQRLMFFVTEDWYFVSHRLALALRAREAGYDVSVVTRVGDKGGEIERAGIRLYPLEIHRSGMNFAREFFTLLKLIRVYRKERPAIVHHVAMKPVLYGAVAARFAGVRNVVNALTGLGFVYSSSTLRARLLRPFARFFLGRVLRRQGARLILQNGDDVALLTGSGLVARSAVRLIRGSGVDVARVAFAPEPDTALPVVVFPARLLRDKGVAEFVEAAKILKQRGVKARFALVGAPDPLNPTSLSEREIEELKKEGIVEPWGWREDMTAVFQQCNLVCLPSYREGLPKALLEAAACGRAIVAADVPGCREIVRHGVNGWLVKARDAVALAGAMQEALARGDLRAAYGQKGREIVEEEFSLERVIGETMGVYGEILG